MLERLIESISPKWASQRARHRRIKASYEGAEPSRTRSISSMGGSPNQLTSRSATKLRNEARHLERNLDLARGALDVLVANVVGTGVRPEPQIRQRNGEMATELNEQIQELWEDWAHKPEVTWTHDLYGMQRLACRAWLRDGEVFGQMISGRRNGLDHGTRVPYSVELIESDWVPFEVNEPGVVQGIAVNEWGRPRGYWVHKMHPNDLVGFGSLKRVEADRMVHLALRDRIRQMRGVTAFASVINRLKDIKDIEESERVAARVAAAMAGYIKKGEPAMYGQDATGRNDASEYREIDWEPGIIFDDLRPGEEVGTIGSQRPNNALIPFRESQLRAFAAGFGSSYSSTSKDYNGTFSAQRQELVEQHLHYGVLHSQFVAQFHRPIYERFIDVVLSMVDAQGIDQGTIYNASHSRPVMPWVDPVKEAKALEIMRDRGWKSDSQIVRERGENFQRTIDQIRRDQDYKAANEVRNEEPN